MSSQRAATTGINSINLVHPELREAITVLTARDPAALVEADEALTPAQLVAILPELRQAWAADTSHVPACARMPTVTERLIPGLDGASSVRVYVIATPSDLLRPAILHMHGGGFIVGTAKEYAPVLQAQVSALDCIIVSVDYRLAPETQFPGALEDCYAALQWVHEHAEELGIDRTRIAVQGESAGGGHAAMLAIAARDRGKVPVMFQCLTYPMLDDRTGSVRHVPPHVGKYCWTPKYNRMGWSAHLGFPAGSPEVPYGSVPARVEDLKGLPPTFIWVGSIDLFAQESMDFASRLAIAGVPIELHVVPGAYHGFDGAAPSTLVTIAYKLQLFDAFAKVFGVPLRQEVRQFLTQCD